MKRNVLFFVVALTLTAAIFAVSAGTTRVRRQQPSIELGEHLVTILACNDCHTPFKMGAEGPEPDMSRMLSGHPQDLVMPVPPSLGDGPWQWLGSGTNTAYAGPWGVSYTANLTPDVNTGIGIWTEQMFVDAIRTGRHMGQSRTIQPPMPWPAFRHMTDRELRSIYAYLRTIPPIENRVPDYQAPGTTAEL